MVGFCAVSWVQRFTADRQRSSEQLSVPSAGLNFHRYVADQHRLKAMVQLTILCPQLAPTSSRALCK